MVDHFEIVKTQDEYEALPEKYSYDALVVFVGAHVRDVLNDQAANSSRLRFVQALSTGIDGYLKAETFRDSDHITLANVRGERAFSKMLAEFIALGMLYHAKKVEMYQA